MPTKRPDVLDVPPELRPYYREQAVAARVRYTAVRVLSIVLVAAVLIGGGALLWMHRHGIGSRINNTIISISTKTPKKPTPKSVPKKNQSQNKVAANNDQQNKQSSGQQNTSPSQNGNSGNISSGSTVSDQSNQQQSTPMPSSQPSNTTVATNNGSTSIPNTGPGGVTILSAIGVGTAAAAVHYMHKRRVARLHR